MTISMIAAVASNGVIGKENDLAWHLPDDMQFFKNITKGKPVIMGRKNWDSIPPKWRPLAGRMNIVITRNRHFSAEGATIVHTLQDAINLASKENNGEIFIIGGSEIYKLGFEFATKLYITEVQGTPEGDTFFPKWDSSDWLEIERKHHPKDHKHLYSFDFVTFIRKQDELLQK